MSPKGNHHEIVKHALTHYWARRVPDRLTFLTETTFRLTPDTYLEPDFVFYDKATGIKGLKAETAHLVVEIADSSFSYDIGRKAALYASFGIPELWVIHAVRLETRVHRKPSLTGYQSMIDLPGGPAARAGLRAGAGGDPFRSRTQLSHYCPTPAGGGGNFIRPMPSCVSEPK